MRNEIAARRRESVKGLHKQSRSYRFLADDFAEILLLAEDTDATKEGLGPLHLRGPSRCASRGYVLPKNFDAAGGRGDQPKRHADSCCFARAVGAKKTKDFAALNLQVEVIHGESF